MGDARVGGVVGEDVFFDAAEPLRGSADVLGGGGEVLEADLEEAFEGLVGVIGALVDDAEVDEDVACGGEGEGGGVGGHVEDGAWVENVSVGERCGLSVGCG